MRTIKVGLGLLVVFIMGCATTEKIRKTGSAVTKQEQVHSTRFSI